MTGRDRGRRAVLRAIGGAGLAAVAGCTAPVERGTTATRTPGAPAAAEPSPTAGSPYTRVYRETVDSVVLVQVAGPLGGGQGSGFVFDAAGHVLTNQHVVARAERIDLRFSDGTWRPATVLGTDGYSDLAVLGVDDRPAIADRIPFADPPPAIGTEVVAIGSPFGLEKSLSVGVVSGVNRAIPTEGGFTIPDAVQTDAAVNPGNSGGPLVTLDGVAVGVIRSGGGENIGFAISGALVERVAPALIDRGRYRHPYLGVAVLDVTPTVAEANGLETATGVLVGDVAPGGPADGVLRGSDDTRSVAGVDVPVGGDVIVGLDGRPVGSRGALGRELALETSPGQTVSVRIVRAEAETTVELTLGARPPL